MRLAACAAVRKHGCCVCDHAPWCSHVLVPLRCLFETSTDQDLNMPPFYKQLQTCRTKVEAVPVWAECSPRCCRWRCGWAECVSPLHCCFPWVVLHDQPASASSMRFRDAHQQRCTDICDEVHHSRCTKVGARGGFCVIAIFTH